MIDWFRGGIYGIFITGGLDWRIVVEVPLRNFAPWLVVVILATIGHAPGVICITPMAWLLALRVGIGVAARSRSETPSRRLQEAVLAGALLGFLQGGLFAVIVPMAGPLLPGEQVKAFVLNALMLGGGMLVSAGLSAVMAWRIERIRRGSTQTSKK